MSGPAEEREPLKLREKAYDSFTQHLLANSLHAGQFISQRELVELTQMPLGAIRELVPRLEAEGLIKTVPQRGMQIMHIDLTMIRDAYQFRLFLEKEATAAFTRTAPDATLAALRAQHEEIIARAQSEGTTPAVVDAAQATDWGLHDIIIDALGNEIISKAYRVNSIKIRLIRRELVGIAGLVVPVMREHLGILEAIESRDPARAAETIAAHIANARNRALGL